MKSLNQNGGLWPRIETKISQTQDRSGNLYTVTFSTMQYISAPSTSCLLYKFHVPTINSTQVLFSTINHKMTHLQSHIMELPTLSLNVFRMKAIQV